MVEIIRNRGEQRGRLEEMERKNIDTAPLPGYCRIFFISPQSTLTSKPVAIGVINGLFETILLPKLIITSNQHHPYIVHCAPKQSGGPGSIEVGEICSINTIVNDGGNDGSGIGQNSSKEKDGEET